jgi:hypothetical protein
MSQISRYAALLPLAFALSAQVAASEFCDTYIAEGAMPGADVFEGGECKQLFHGGASVGENNIPSPPRSRAFKIDDPEEIYLRACGLRQLLKSDARTHSYVTLAEVTYTAHDTASNSYALLITASSAGTDKYTLQADVYLTGSAELSITDPESLPAEPISSSIVLGTVDENCGSDVSTKHLKIDFSQEGSVLLNLGNPFPPENDVAIRPAGQFVPLLRKNIFAGPMIASNVSDGTLFLGWRGIHDPE